ncbi:MAG: putative protein YcjX [Hyphomicrobiaceae bacterium hypho_1]
MRLSAISDTALDLFRSTEAAVSDVVTPSLRLGVTGLSRAGKTVFITALVHTLTNACASPSLPLEHLRGFRAFLEPQPDDDVPRFAYEQHLKMLQNDIADWPESTRQISQLRLTLEWEASDTLRRLAGLPRRLHVDIIDYPGEWLLDLGLLSQSYQTWSREINAAATRRLPDECTKTWLSFIHSRSMYDLSDEQIAIEGAQKFTHYLRSLKEHNRYAQFISPGRFLLPGEFEGSPLLTFFPLSIVSKIDEPVRPGTLGALLSKRFESYKQQVVRPFFERHFKSLDRQIVLVDVLGALNGGAEAIEELETTLLGALQTFRPGRQSWLGRLIERRIERVMFAATKADLIHGSNHHRLNDLIRVLLSRAMKRVDATGADVDVTSLASLRATEDVEYNNGRFSIPCIRGQPKVGEISAGRLFNGQSMAAIFPGDLPDDAYDIFDKDIFQAGALQFVRFQPPRPEYTHLAKTPQWPHIGLDRIVRYLIGDRLT